eukprot:CAMPEP_0119005724 /NCGR_PEP_ID=MMETSP1176-20130426/1893_1 /TAXON_ID=265551 /ORGANISM="Synedropsis recta cf, Strain CCMP1620" /LENGTH=151 /DNA_ID=CAMNT_0006957565 /DNA_START=41 /DNA_END=496 /DNA_ORIENTATION=-
MALASQQSQRLIVSPLRSFSAAPTASEATKQKVLKMKKAKDEGPSNTQLFIHAGLPMIAFSLMAAWVLKNSIEGKNKEFETSRGQASKSQRQARMDEEQNDMLEKLTKIRNTDFDNTKRIERPEEILDRRKRERERRNVWYRRFGRWVIGQ